MSSNYEIERHIITGMIMSDEYMKQIVPIWTETIMLSDLGLILSKWCVEYYKKYNTTPKTDIEVLYFDKIKKQRLDNDLAADIEELLLDLSDEYERDQFNVQYIVDKTKEYFLERGLHQHQGKIEKLLDAGRVDEANALAAKYSPPMEKSINIIDLSDPEVLKAKLQYAFSARTDPMFKYPGAIGDLLNEFMTRDSFIAFFAPEKRGKSIILLDLAMRAARQGCNVAFFQAGDMSEDQQLIRIAINRTRKNNKAQYVGKQMIPVKDCIKNQLDQCDLPEREGIFGIFEESEITDASDITKDVILEKMKENPDYSPCSNCLSYRKNNWGSPWLVEKDLGLPLTQKQAEKALGKFFVEKKRRFKLATYPAKTLTVQEIEKQCNTWEKEEGFIVDVIVIDYADIMISHVAEFRHSQDDIWAHLRSLSQKRHALVAAATQADAKSYKQDILTMDNFSEDKRKISHVTAAFGINMDAAGREKNIGLARINTIVARDGEYAPHKCVTILQSLGQAVPILTSYYGFTKKSTVPM